jgi:hypothetical protein
VLFDAGISHEYRLVDGGLPHSEEERPNVYRHRNGRNDPSQTTILHRGRR